MQITKARKHCCKHIRALFSLIEQGGTASQHHFGSSEPRSLQISVLSLMQPGCLFWLQLPAFQASGRKGWCLYWKSKTFLEFPRRDRCFSLIGQSNVAQPPQTRATEKCRCVTGNGRPKQDWGLVSKERGKKDIGEATSCLCDNQEISYISQSPETQQASGSSQ